MTKLAEGSPLLQGPEPNLDHQHPLPDGIRSLPQHVAHDKRQLGEPASVVAQVIQTVEVIQVVDPNGVPVSIQTVFPPPTTRLVDSVTGDVLEIIDTLPNAPPPPSLPTDVAHDSDNIPLDITLDVPIEVPDISSANVPTAVPPVVTDVVGDVLPSDKPLTDPASVADTIPDLSATNSTITNSSQDTTSSTSTPLSTATFPTLAGPFNGTNGWNGTLLTNSTHFRMKSGRSSTVSLATSESTAGAVVVATDAPAPAPAPAPPADVAAAPLEPAPEVHRGGLPDPPPTSAVVGISVGSIAGAALIIFVIMVLIRWKRRNSGKVALGGGLIGNQGLLTGGNSGGEMTQRSLPSSVPGALLASLSRFKRQSAEPRETSAQERSFYRVSGRKLPSVFEHGGDGYTDPRQSVLSGTSSNYRDSRILDAEGGVPMRLALGSPMRPVSGVPVMRSGPARTPITEDNPFSDPPTPSTVFGRDPLGRSLTGQDGSPGSSRFAEEV